MPRVTRWVCFLLGCRSSFIADRKPFAPIVRDPGDAVDRLFMADLRPTTVRAARVEHVRDATSITRPLLLLTFSPGEVVRYHEPVTRKK
jgi:hypothetical protein